MDQNNAVSIRLGGDAARDRHEWQEASLLYQQYLKLYPDDAGVWIQLGHVLKEGGRIDEAKAAYHDALVLTPDDADLHLHIGHLLSMTGQVDQAVRSYTASMRIAPTMAAYARLAAMGREKLAKHLLAAHENVSRKPVTYLQVTDFFNYLLTHKTVSGIQRVQLGIITHVLTLSPEEKSKYQIVYNKTDSIQLWALQADKLRTIADYLGTPGVDHDTLKSHIEAAMNNAEAVTLQPGDTCVIAGSFWGDDTVVELLRECRRQGVYTAVYFYDVLPVTHPEFFDAQLVTSFRQRLYQVFMLLDFGMGISDFTVREVRRLLAEKDLPPVPLQAVTLAHAFKDVLPVVVESDGDQAWPPAIATLQSRRFVLCVCTIEIRKNHRFLFEAWKALIADGQSMPDLVLVGRPGWRVDDLMAQFETTRYLQGSIHVVHDLSDAELAMLYRHCLFTVFPSFVEGWGLPIGESLSYGKLCIASNTSSMPEVGGDLVEYMDPLNLRSGIETLRRAVEDADWVTEREAAIRDRFRPKLWDEVGADLIAATAALRQEVGSEPHRPAAPELVAGRVYSLSSDDYDPVDYTQQVLRLALTSRWFLRESFGIWMGGNTAGLGFRTNLAPGDQVVALLQLHVVPWATEHSLTVVDAAGSAPPVPLSPGRSMVIRVKTRANEDGYVEFTLRVNGKVRAQGSDTRDICVGLSRFGFAPRSDGGARLELVEQLLA